MNNKKIKRFKYRVIFFVMLIFLLISQNKFVYAKMLDSFTPKNKIEVEQIKTFIDDEISQWVNDKLVKGAIVSVVKDNRVVLSKGYGYADEKNNIEADENTLFRIGSVSKTIVALSAMQLEMKGKLDMDAPITNYLEADFPKFKHTISMKNLLTHTAGFEEMISGLCISEDEELKPLGEVLREFIPYQFFEPGEVSVYSNYGIALAGYIVERISGQNFYDYAEKNIFNQLGMKNSTFKRSFTNTSVISKGYSNNGDERIESIINLYPPGSMITTSQDMAKYITFLLNGNTRILEDRSRLQMFNKQFSMDKEFPGIGYTWGRFMRNGHLIYAHAGRTDNFSTVLFICPKEKIGIFISSNTQGDKPDEIMNKLVDMLFGKEREKELYGEKNLKDISGHYILARSSFKNSEKIISLIASNPIQIKGNNIDGFTLKDNKFKPVGKESYFYPNLGYVKFIEKNGRSYIINEQGSTFLRIPWYESGKWSLFILILFIVSCIMGVIVNIILLILFFNNKKKSIKKLILSISPTIIGFITFTYAVIRIISFIKNPVYADIDELILSLKGVALIATVSGMFAIISTIYVWCKKYNMIFRLYSLFWCISFLIFISWLYQVNLLV